MSKKKLQKEIKSGFRIKKGVYQKVGKWIKRYLATRTTKLKHKNIEYLKD